jgi:hypothetical protein
MKIPDILPAVMREHRFWFWLFASASGLAQCWSYRFWIEPDGVNYLDGATPCQSARSTTPFKGEVGLSYKDSKPDFPKQIQAPKGAPNICWCCLMMSAMEPQAHTGARSTNLSLCTTLQAQRTPLRSVRKPQRAETVGHFPCERRSDGTFSRDS